MEHLLRANQPLLEELGYTVMKQNEAPNHRELILQLRETAIHHSTQRLHFYQDECSKENWEAREVLKVKGKFSQRWD